GKQFTHRVSEPRVYCGPECRSLSLLTMRPPKDPFNRFVYDRWIESGSSLSRFAEAHGLSDGALRTTLAGKAPLRRTLDRLRAAFGDALPETRTETDRRRERIAAVAHLRPEPGSEAWRLGYEKAAATRRGRKMDPAAVARSRATKRATGVQAAEAGRLR